MAWPRNESLSEGGEAKAEVQCALVWAESHVRPQKARQIRRLCESSLSGASRIGRPCASFSSPISTSLAL